jgi:hypothetical protein
MPTPAQSITLRLGETVPLVFTDEDDTFEGLVVSYLVGERTSPSGITKIVELALAVDGAEASGYFYVDPDTLGVSRYETYLSLTDSFERLEIVDGPLLIILPAIV